MHVRTLYVDSEIDNCGDYNYDSISIRVPFDCYSTALRPVDDLRHDKAAALRPK